MFPSLNELPIEGEAMLLILGETLLKHRIWLDGQMEKKDDTTPGRPRSRISRR